MLREAVVMDSSKSFEDHELIKDGQCYIFTNINIHQYFIKKLSMIATCIVANYTIKHTELDWTTIDMTQFDKVEAATKAKITQPFAAQVSLVYHAQI